MLTPITLDPQEDEVMKLAITAVCQKYWYQEPKDYAMWNIGWHQERSEDGKLVCIYDVGIRYLLLYLKDSDKTGAYGLAHKHCKDRKDVLHFCVKVFENCGVSDSFSIAGLISGGDLHGIIETSGTLIENSISVCYLDPIIHHDPGEISDNTYEFKVLEALRKL